MGLGGPNWGPFLFNNHSMVQTSLRTRVSLGLIEHVGRGFVVMAMLIQGNSRGTDASEVTGSNMILTNWFRF